MIRDDLKKATGVEITAVGVGDKVSLLKSSALDRQAHISALLCTVLILVSI